ncbi:MAG: nucleotidyltransferase domain-containing protein [Bryobacterales bacterium]|nr:nucleotidyltransferase domain-containing protein [Bryobacterales bacterium]
MTAKLEFPTPMHRRAAEAVVDFCLVLPVQAVLLVNSCARGTATAESDLDIALLIDPEMSTGERRLIEQAWRERYGNGSIFRELEGLSPFAGVHLDIFDGRWVPEPWDDGGGPDAFEIEIGNRVAHSVPLWERGNVFEELCGRWLPYYGEAPRVERLRMVSAACRLNIERVHAAVKRDLNFYGFDRLYHALQEFLQALFISRGIYPVAYNKWIREQLEVWLGLPAL